MNAEVVNTPLWGIDHQGFHVDFKGLIYQRFWAAHTKTGVQPTLVQLCDVEARSRTCCNRAAYNMFPTDRLGTQVGWGRLCSLVTGRPKWTRRAS